FAPKPATFSSEAVQFVSEKDDALVNRLIQLGILEEVGATRVTLHQTLSDYVGIKSYSVAYWQRAVQFFSQFLSANESAFGQIELEIDHILKCLKFAEDSKHYFDFIRISNLSYHYFHVKGMYRFAKPFLEKSVGYANDLKSYEEGAVALVNLGRMFINEADYPSAIEHLTEALRLSQFVENDDLKSRINQAIGVAYDYQGDFKTAISQYEKSLQFARKTNNLKRVCTLLMNLGGVHLDLTLYEDALTYLTEGLQIAKEINHEGILSPMLLNLGSVAGSLGKYDDELDYYTEALQTARKMGHREDICFLLSNMGALSRTLGEFEVAENYLLEGLQIANEDNLFERKSSLFRHLATLEIYKGDYSKARRYAEDGIEIARDKNNQRNLCPLLNLLGEINLIENQFELAAENIDEAFEIADGIEHQWFIAEAKLRKSKLFFRTGHHKEALAKANEALKLAKEKRIIEVEAEAYLLLGQIESDLGEKLSATASLETAVSIFKSLNHWRQHHAEQVFQKTS
ncbi:MAG: tetratricopeptide repeat protein, partial [Chloroflexota bacterium]